MPTKDTCSGCGRVVARTANSADRILCHLCRAGRQPRSRMPDYVPPSRSDQCAECGAAVTRSWTSASRIVCRVCRRKARPPAPTPKPLEARTCTTCGEAFEQRQATQIYCNPGCRPRRGWAPSPRKEKYGAKHAAARRQWARRLEREGKLPCSLCGEPVLHGTTWHLDHVPGSDTEYRGVSHPSCNTSDGARRGALSSNRSPRRRQVSSVPVTLASGRSLEVQMRQCETCGKRCFGIMCKDCRDMARRAKRKAEPQRPLLSVCEECGQPHTRRAKRCEACEVQRNRTNARNNYRAKVGIPPDVPLYQRADRLVL